MNLPKLIYHLKYPFKLWMYELIDQWVMLTVRPKLSKKILVYRLDLIGDYLMCRPFFHSLRQKYETEGYSLVFAGNQVYKDVATSLDSQEFAEFLWLDRPRFINSISYRFRVLKQIRQSGFEKVIYPSHTRQYWLESILRVSGAEDIFVPQSIGTYMNEWELTLSRRWHHYEIETGPIPLFEFFRNRNFFDHFSSLASDIQNLNTQIPKVTTSFLPQGPFVVIAPGASTPDRRWPVQRFAEVVKALSTIVDFEFVVIGSMAEKHIGEELNQLIPVSNLAGRLSLLESLFILSKATLLFSNESAPIHMAATVGTPSVCISQGNHFGRWNPYPISVAPLIRTVYPRWFSTYTNAELSDRFHDQSSIDIQDVVVEDVVNAAKELFSST